MSKKYPLAVLGGTFDRFHQGHQHLIARAVRVADKIMIGVTTKELNQHKLLSQIILNYDDRVQELTDYLNNNYKSSQISVFPLADPYGLSVIDTNIKAVIVTPLTLPGAKAINRLRQAKGLEPIAIEVADMVSDNSGEYLSSTRIRQGIVNRYGFVYQSLFSNDIKLTPNQKSEISQPQGDVIDPNRLSAETLTAYSNIALVGDQVTEYFIAHHLPFQIAAIDYQSNRLPYKTNLGSFNPQNRLKFANPPGIITANSAKVIFNLRKDQTALITVEGEEDLLGFPLALSLPLGSCIIYGQPKVGMIKITLNESSKDRLARLISPKIPLTISSQ